MPDHHADYDAMAWFYNRYWADFPSRIMPVIDALVLDHVPPPAAVLDLCCGTGQLAAQLTERRYQVTGVDLSEAQLGFARQNAPDAQFHRGDVRSIDLGGRFDVVLCTYDSLNHMMSRGDLAKALSTAYVHLRSGGLFLFDLNTDESYRRSWDGSLAIIDDDHVCAAQAAYDPEERLAVMWLTTFKQEEQQWHRRDITFHQRCYEVDEVTSILVEVGFATVSVHAGDDFTGHGAGGERAIFCCTKG